MRRAQHTLQETFAVANKLFIPVRIEVCHTGFTTSLGVVEEN